MTRLYIRSLRWASDRINGCGIIAFVSNGSFIRSETAAGIRACLAEEFDEIWCLDLRGNARTQGETRRREGGNVFGAGSRVPIAVVILVRNPEKTGCTIRYKDIGVHQSAKQKLGIVATDKSVHGMNGWRIIRPDRHHDWLDHRDDEFSKYAPMGDRTSKAGTNSNALFGERSAGVLTSRDRWAYNSSKERVTHNMKNHIIYCNGQDWKNPQIDPKSAKWDRDLAWKLAKRREQKPAESKIRTSLYRPFFRQWLYFDGTFNSSRHKMPQFFPEGGARNPTICVPYRFTGKFSAFITDTTPDAQLNCNGQCFPFYTYQNGGDRKSNITDRALDEYRTHYMNTSISKKDIFYYVYGLLHHPSYRAKFANNLSRELPRIPMAPDFAAFKNTGQKLANLHLGFESCERYNLGRPKFDPKGFTKLAFGKMVTYQGGEKTVIPDHSVIRADGTVLFDNVPDTKYRVNGRTPVEWIVDRYRKTVDRDSGITNDPCTGTDIVGVIERAVYVGIESDRLAGQLPEGFEPRNWKPKGAGLDLYSGEKVP